MRRFAYGIRSALGTLGQQTELERTDGTRERASVLIVPVDSVSENARTAQGLPDGYYPPGSYQVFALPEAELEDARILRTETAAYAIRRAECYTLGGVRLYWWGLLIRIGEADEEA